MDKSSKDLSLMAHQIRSIDDIRLNKYLLRLNLHSNEIQRISGLTSLNYLTDLDLSSNKINRIQGLEGLLALKKLNLSSNRLILVEGLFPLKNLVELNLSYNRIERLKGFQDLFSDQYNLKIIFLHGNQLDSFDEISMNLSGLTKLEYLTLKENPIANDNFYRRTILNRLKKLKSLDDLDREMTKNSKIHSNEEEIFDSTLELTDEHHDNNKEDSKLIFDEYPKIEQVRKQFDDNRDESIDQSSSYPRKTNLIRSNKIDSKSFSPNKVEEFNRLTINDLNIEKDRRWRLEQENEELKREISRLKGKDDQESIVNQLNENYQRRINDQKSKIDDLTKIFDQNQKRLKSYEEQIESYKKAQQQNLETIEKLECKIGQIISENNLNKISKEEEKKKFEDENRLLTKENLLLKQEKEDFKIQLEQCRQLYTDREIQIKEKTDEQINVEKLKRFIENEKTKQNDLFLSESQHQEEKYKTLLIEYKKLENEFRDALQIEERRYQQLFKSNEILLNENEILQSNSKKIKEKEQSNRKMLDDLINLVKEQKQRIKEKNKINEELNTKTKQTNAKLDKTVEELKKIREQLVLVDKERKQVEHKIVSQQSIIDGLRQEKQIWSEELAHQGSSLAQDRGRLESTIEILQSEQINLKKQIEKELDNNKIKQTIIQSQTETIQKLKDGIVERDQTIKQLRQDLIQKTNEFKDKIDVELNLYRELNEKYEKACLKRDSFKEDFIQIEEELNQTRQEYNALTKKWKEKSDLINELDNKIRRASENYQINEKKLTEENQRLVEKQKDLEEKLHRRDDEFRRQLETIETGHRQSLNQIRVQYQEKLDLSEQRLKQVEDEMRFLLSESNQKQKIFQEKIKHFSSLISELQQNNSD